MPSELNGLRKSAILLQSLHRDQAAGILRRLPPDAAEEVQREMSALGDVTTAARNDVFSQFYNLARAHSYLSGDDARDTPHPPGKLGTAEKAERTTAEAAHDRPLAFACLQTAKAEQLLPFIHEEHPQTIALIIAHLPPTKASEILVGLPLQKQIEVIKRIASLEQTSPDVVREVERGLEFRVSEFVNPTSKPAGGADAVAEILNASDRSTEKEIIHELEANSPGLAEQLRRLMFVFEDILLVDDAGIRSVLEQVDDEALSLALKTASDDLKRSIFRNMPRHAAQSIQNVLQAMGPVRLSDMEQAQAKIADIVCRLESDGKIIVAARGNNRETGI